MQRYGFFEVKLVNAEEENLVRVVTYMGFAFWVKKSKLKKTKQLKAWNALSNSKKKALTKVIGFKSKSSDDQTIAQNCIKNPMNWCERFGLFVLEVSNDGFALVVCKNGYQIEK